MSQQEREGSIRVGFLAFKEFERGYRGGILVTDGGGRPLEFRCTSPIRPNQVQRVLYGRTLLPHIAVQLMGVPLTASVSEKPSLIIVNQGVFLDLRESVHQPVLLVRRQGETLAAEDPVQKRTEPEGVLLECEGSRFDPVVIETHRKYRDEVTQSRQHLRDMFDRLDLLEPFERVVKALDEVERQKAVDA
jgi:hypothetical protein